MPSRSRRPAPELSGSWVAMNEDTQSVELTSDEETTTPQVNLSASRADHLHDALGMDRSSLRPRQAAAKGGSATISRQPEVYGIRSQPTFVMPTLEHTSSYEDGSLARVRRSAARRSPAKAKSQSFRNDGNEIFPNFLESLLSYLLSVVGMMFRIAKPLITYALAIYLLFGCLIILRNLFINGGIKALYPFCRIPGVSNLGLYICDTQGMAQTHGDVQFDKLIAAQTSFEEIMISATDRQSLPFQMKISQISIRDLRPLVRYSKIPSRDKLLEQFSIFITATEKASQEFQVFNSDIGTAVDRIALRNHYTLRAIDDITAGLAAQGSIVRYINEGPLFALFRPGGTSSRLSRDVLYEQYLKHAETIEGWIAKLIKQAESILPQMNNLEKQLDKIHDIATEDGLQVKGSRDELLPKLYTWLGGNKRDLKALEEQLTVLKEVGAQRRRAVEHVGTSLVRLQAIAAALASLKEQVAAPPDESEIPLEMHIEQIAKSMERLEALKEHARQVEDRRWDARRGNDDFTIEGGKSS
ncbi:hypothetical protein K461DRAFT_110965 [Myriangium duriaei CBS 260.36]|uniref:Uncharacterized protein n=1 Tax=Myriangium duriaei CBS 260.36 TaxID=1168546 RepID=A0A9P4JAH5_9PEZI|nr:hypothetical protein K461DRAFT_110965 [Myriangium duriaei CBS 260.36]